MAAHLGTSTSAVARISRVHGLKPHRVESFELFNDTRFIEKLEDILGLYPNPPDHAWQLCCDEKTQIQALGRTQPDLPLKRGAFANVTELEAAINAYIAAHSAKPKPFIWPAKATCARNALNKSTSN